MNGRSSSMLLAALLAVTTVGVIATRASDLSDRLNDLMDKGHYGLAQDILEDRLTRGEALDHETRWLRASLETNPDEFDRQLHELLQATSSGDPRAPGWTTARAVEHFAQGRYQTAADLLSAQDESSLLGEAQAPLYLGMALQALGQSTEAELAFARIPEDHPAHTAAITLRSELALRAGNWRGARQLAMSVSDDEDYGAQARLVLAQVARAEGAESEAADWIQRIRRDFPRAVEGSWGRAPENVSTPTPTGFHEIDAPDPRRGYALQLGAFRDRSLALRFSRDLVRRFGGRLENLRVEVDRSESPPWYRVVAGSYVTRPQAQRAARDLGEENLAAIVLGPERGQR
jgi:tetratricopeptide (TPR) repeat protein